MTYTAFSVSELLCGTPAEGWLDGVYRKRCTSRTDTGKTYSSGELTLSCRHWREKEESGWGVFDYIEGTELSFESGLADFTLKARFNNPTDAEIPLRARVNDVTVLHSATLEPNTETEVSFTFASVDEISRVIFYIPDENVTERDAAPVRELYLLSLEAELLPLREAEAKPTVFLASDSTVQTYDPYYHPQTGWGEVLYKYFKNADFVSEYKPEGASYSHCRAYELPAIAIENRAIGGRSSLSFYLEGKCSELLLRVKKGDTVLIQFGHNDATKARPNRYVSIPEYKECLRRYVRAVAARGAAPVLVTPVMRRNYDEEKDSFSLAFAEHREAMLSLASEEGVTLLDLGKKSHEICCEIGGEGTKSVFLWTQPDTYRGAYKNGSTDSTHLQRRGALIFAGAVAELIASEPSLSGIARHLDSEKDYRHYYPTKKV